MPEETKPTQVEEAQMGLEPLTPEADPRLLRRIVFATPAEWEAAREILTACWLGLGRRNRSWGNVSCRIPAIARVA